MSLLDVQYAMEKLWFAVRNLSTESDERARYFQLKYDWTAQTAFAARLEDASVREALCNPRIVEIAMEVVPTSFEWV